MTGSFYIPLGGGRWRATGLTAGPWDGHAQHGGPPSALLGRAVERCEPRDNMIVSRLTCEILGAIPIGELQVQARLARAGRRVELIEAVLRAGGRPVARASAWRVLRTSAPPAAGRRAPPPDPPLHARGLTPGPEGGNRTPGPEREDPSAAWAGQPHVRLPSGWTSGYLSAVDWRVVRGGFGVPGPATVWARLRHPLVPDEETSPLQRVLALADSASGVSHELPLDRWLFINPELSVHLHREAAGEWICLDATTTISTGGAGLATSVLSDRQGPVGVSAQSLLVTPRDGGGTGEPDEAHKAAPRRDQ